MKYKTGYVLDVLFGQLQNIYQYPSHMDTCDKISCSIDCTRSIYFETLKSK